MTSLVAACYQGNTHICKKLLQCVTPRTVNSLCGEHNDSVFHVIIRYEPENNHTLLTACYENDIDAVHTLLYSSDANLQGSDGCTPLHLACLGGNVDIVHMLLSVHSHTTTLQMTTDKRRAKQPNNVVTMMLFRAFLG